MSPAEAKRVEDMADKLAEDWEVVQILVSRYEPGGTQPYFHGLGNWYGRQGMAHEFVKLEEARTAAKEIGNAINPEEE